MEAALPDTHPPDPVTENAIARLPSGRLVHVDEIDGHIALVSEIDDDGQITSVEKTWLASRLTLVSPAPPKPGHPQDISEAARRTVLEEIARKREKAREIDEAWRKEVSAAWSFDKGGEEITTSPGMIEGVTLDGIPSRRDLAAHAALPALLIGATTGEIDEDAGRIAFRAYRVADALEYAARDAVDTRPVYEAELRRVTRIFERYADIHRAKGTEEGNRKAEENAAEAGRIRNLMRKAREADARASVTRQDLEADIGILLAQIDAARENGELSDDPEDMALVEQIRAGRKARTGEAAR